MTIDNPSVNDNRNYNFISYHDSERGEFGIISQLIPSGSRVIDLGCGNGSLLQLLQKERSATVKGMELSASGVQVCKSKGLDVVKGRIDEILPFADNSFDYAVCNVTIQMVMYPEVLMQEMKRIARYQIVSFPNFAFWRNRVDLLFNGRMPKKMLFEYQWYSTGHIHQFSIKDFYELMDDIGGLKVVRNKFEHSPNVLKNYFMQLFPNLFQMVPIFLLKKEI